MRRAAVWSLSLAALAVAGCGLQRVDSCAHVAGTCVDVQLEGSGRVDSVRVQVTGDGIAVDQETQPARGGAQSLPMALPLTFASVADGQAVAVDVLVTAHLESGAAAAGSVQASVTGGKHASVTVRLTATGGGGSGGGGGGGGCDARPTPTISAPSTSICPGGQLVLTASEADSYLWSTGETTRAITVDAAGSYTVTVDGCMTPSDPYVVTQSSTSSITAGGPLTFCAGSSVTLTASAGTSYAWSTGATTASITVSTSGMYTVQVGGCAVSAPATVTVKPLPPPQTLSFPFTKNIDSFTVLECLTSIRIEADGAAGGSSDNANGGQGGNGARMIGTFAVTPGEQLLMIVGQKGINNTSDGGGGGGGSFVWRASALSKPMIAAGGGGGGSGYKPGGTIPNTCLDKNGALGQTGTDGTAGFDSGNGGAKGTNGNGGAEGASNNGGGGGGWLTAATGALGGHAMPGGGGDAAGQFNGGFGGGGTPARGGGAGGGYSGGGGGAYYTFMPDASTTDYFFCGGGAGGSYNAGTQQTNSAGARAGDGVIIISW